MGGDIWDEVAPVLGGLAGGAIGSVVPGVGTAIGASLGAGIGGGTEKGVKTGNPLAGLTAGVLDAGGSYIGGNIGNSLLTGSTFGAPASNFISNALGNGTVGNAIGGLAGNATVGGLTGGAIGGAIGNEAGNAVNAPGGGLGIVGGPSTGSPPPGSSPQMQMPGSLANLSTLTPNQQASNIATQGVYGGGNGPQEEQYFTNLINRQLTDPSQGGGQPQSGMGGQTYNSQGTLSPIENSYLGQLGLGGYGNTQSLLTAINGWTPNG